GVVLAKLALERAGETPDGNVEPRRVELTLVPAPGDEIESPASAPPDDVVACPIDGSIAAATPLVRQGRGVADARHDHAADDPREPILVAREPADRSDRPGNEEQAIGVTAWEIGKRGPE